MEDSKQNIQLQAIVVILGILLLAGKFLAYILTHSNAILTDALESIVNVLAGLFGLYSLWLAAQPKDHNHPYGHGKIEFVSASLEGSLITIAGISIAGKAIYNFFYPTAVKQLDIGLLLTAIAGLINYGLGIWAARRGRQQQSPTLVASGQHLKSDAYSTVGLLLGLSVLWFTGWNWLDNVIALIFAGIIGWTGYRILREALGGIMDEVDPSRIEEIVAILESHRRENWIDIHNLRIIRYGSELHIDCHLTVPWYFQVPEAHDEVDHLEVLLNDKIAAPVELFVHTDACRPKSCSLCNKQNCPVRQAPFEALVPWQPAQIMRNAQHHHHLPHEE